MALPQTDPTMSFPEYVAWSRDQDIKYEFYAGKVYAMAGGTTLHAWLVGQALFHLRLALQGRPCRAFASDLRVRIPESGLATYPDCLVVCGRIETDPEDADSVTNPVVLVEVLSKSTEAYDRGQKFEHYRKLPSLQHYLLVAQDRPHVEHYARTADGGWVLRDATAGSVLQLHAIDVALPIDALYEGVDALRAGAAPPIR